MTLTGQPQDDRKFYQRAKGASEIVKGPGGIVKRILLWLFTI